MTKSRSLHIILFLLLIPVFFIQAQDTESSSVVIKFGDLNLEEITLRGPYDVADYSFNLPASWKLKEDVVLQLVTTIQLASGDSSTKLTVKLNDSFTQTIRLDANGSQTFWIPIPSSNFKVVETNSLEVVLDNYLDCVRGNRAAMVIQSDSIFNVEYEVAPPAIDLRNLPYPFYDGIVDDTPLLLVIPDEALAQDVQAALTVASSFGKMTDNKLQTTIMSEADLTSTDLNTHNIIYIGSSEKLMTLKDLELPIPSGENGFDVPQSDSGILQIIHSPYNENNTILVVSGNSNDAVVKAAQGLSFDTILTNAGANVALVSSIEEIAETANFIKPTSDFRSIGFETILFNQVGYNSHDYEFFINPDQIIEYSGEIYIDLAITHSALISYDKSRLSIRINGLPIGSIPLNNTTYNQEFTRFKIPGTALKARKNVLSVEANLSPNEECVGNIPDDIWLSIGSNSIFQLPLITTTSSSLQLLKDYPFPAAISLTLDNTVFVLAKDNQESWQIALSLAADLGAQKAGKLLVPQVIFDTEVDLDSLTDKNVIAIGLTDNEAIQSLLENRVSNTEMGSSNLTQFAVDFYQPDEVDLGYLHLIQSSEDNNEITFSILGTSNAGLEIAYNVLSDASQRALLNGNEAIVNGSQILINTINPPEPILEPITATSATEITNIPDVDLSNPENNRLTWIPTVVGLLIIMVIVIAIGVIFTRVLRR